MEKHESFLEIKNIRGEIWNSAEGLEDAGEISQEAEQENKELRKKMPTLKDAVRRFHSFLVREKEWRKLWKKII